MDKAKWLIFTAVCLAIVGGLIYWSKKDSVDVSNIDPYKISTDGPTPDHTSGPADAKVVVFEYADYQCPGCHGAWTKIKAIQEQYKDRIRFVYRNFPLTQMHPNAYAAAATAEAAGMQGKYWEMHDLLFTMYDSWTGAKVDERDELFESYAKQLKLDVAKFKDDMNSKVVGDKIRLDMALGGKIGVNSTPSIFVNQKRLDESSTNDLIRNNGDKLRSIIDAALANQ